MSETANEKRKPRHLELLNAEYPIFSGLTLKVPGGKTLTTIKVASDGVMLCGGEGDFPTNDAWVVACACLDVNKEVVYTLDGARSHSDLCGAFDLDSNQEQSLLKEHIFGFISVGGYFLSRSMAKHFLMTYHPQFLKEPKGCRGWFNSDMIDWYAVAMALKK